MTTYLSLDEVARQLDIDSGAVLALIRTGTLVGMYAPDRSGWLVRPGDLAAYQAEADET